MFGRAVNTVLIVIILLVVVPVYAELISNQDSSERNVYVTCLTKRQLERYISQRLAESYIRFIQSSIFYEQILYTPEVGYGSFPVNRGIFPALYREEDLIANPMGDFMDILPFNDYFIFFDRYLMRDIKVITIRDFGNLRINLPGMAQGHYFMKIHIDFPRFYRRED